MALRWLLHSATCLVLGNPTEGKNNIQCRHAVGYQNKQDAINGVLNNSTAPIEVKPDPLGFQMPLHYPRYTKGDYEKMEEWRVDLLLKEYGLCFNGTIEDKRAYAIGAFLWPDQY